MPAVVLPAAPLKVRIFTINNQRAVVKFPCFRLPATFFLFPVLELLACSPVSLGDRVKDNEVYEPGAMQAVRVALPKPRERRWDYSSRAYRFRPSQRKVHYYWGIHRARTDLLPLFSIWGLPTTLLLSETISACLQSPVTCVDLKQIAASFMGRESDDALPVIFPLAPTFEGERSEFHARTQPQDLFPYSHRYGVAGNFSHSH